MRTGTYMEINGVKLLIDTSPDLRWQLIKNNIKQLDAVLYTHSHADHLHGIDDLREINRISRNMLDIYGTKNMIQTIYTRFPYLICLDEKKLNPVFCAALKPHTIEHEESFMIKGLKVTPIEMLGHNIECTGYIFNDGEVVHFADFRSVKESALKMITRTPEVMIMPLTTPKGTMYHAGLEELKEYTRRIKPKRVIINHMAVESDYEDVKKNCLENMRPTYDGEIIEW
jgi:phosphoribosyl 1,2-cyclic phosphate phosphodiesterase